MPNAPGPMTNPGSKAPAVGQQPSVISTNGGGGNPPVSASTPTPEQTALRAALAPYSTTANGQTTVNLAAALNGGITQAQLLAAGFTQVQITAAASANQIAAALAPYSTTTNNQTSVNLAAALSGGLTVAQLLSAGFTQDQITAAQTANQQQVVVSQITAALAPYSTPVAATSTTPAGMSVDLGAALTGGITQAQLLAAGFTQAQITSALTANQAQATFLANNVKLSDGTYIAKTDFDKLSTTDQASLVKLGLTAFNAQQTAANQAAQTTQQAAQQSFLNQNTQIAGGQYVSNSFYNELTPTAQSILKGQGLAAFNSWLQGTPTTTTITTPGSTTPDTNPAHQMALVTYKDGSTMTMLADDVRKMAVEGGGLAAYDIAHWETIPTPPIVTPPTQQTVTSTTAPSLAQVYSNSTWQPNFNSETNGGNPYAGMPSWYQQVEAAGFVPVTVNGVTSTPPSQEYAPLAAGVTYPTNLGQTTFDAGLAAGAIPEGSIYQGYDPITGQISYVSGAAPANSVKLADGTYVSNAYFGTLSVTDQLKLSSSASLSAFLAQQNRNQAAQSGQPDYNSWAANLPTNLKSVYNTNNGGVSGYNAVGNNLTASLNNVYLTDVANKAGGGMDGYNAAIAAQQAALAELAPYRIQINIGTEDNPRYTDSYDFKEALKHLAPEILYTAGFNGTSMATTTTPYVKPVDNLFQSPVNTGITQSIWTAKLIAENPTVATVQQLKSMNYPQSLVDKAQKYIDNANSALTDINGILTGKQVESGKLQSLLDSVDLAGYAKPHGLGGSTQGAANVQWNVLTDSQKLQVAGIYAQDQWKNNYLSEFYKQESEIAAKGGTVGGLVYGIPLAIEQPYAEKGAGLSPTAMSWLVSGATTATILLPFAEPLLSDMGIAGRAAVGGIEAGSMGIFSTNLAQNWSRMDTAQRIFNVGMLSLPLVGPAIRGVQFLGITSSDDYVPLRSMSEEASTARVKFTGEQLTAMRDAGITDVDILKAGDEINRQLVAGDKVATVNLGPVKVEVNNVPYQQDVGMSLFSSTPDITQVDRGGSVPVFRDFYTAGKAAIEPLERSYLTGQEATHPGIIEVRIADPSVIASIAPQSRLIDNGTVLEPEAKLPSLNELKGMGYRLDPIPGEAGRGVTFDASMGKVEIRRFTLSKVTDNPTGLITVKLGGGGNGGVVGIGDLHATADSASVFHDLNNAYRDPIISGDPADPATWHWSQSPSGDTGRSAVVLGDSIDKGPNYSLWRDTFNRLSDEASSAGDNLYRLLGNHELAYISDDAIKGIEYTDAERTVIKAGILSDLQSGKVEAAASVDGKLFTHAGVSTGVFKEYIGKSSDYIRDDLNSKMLKAAETDNYSSKMFAKGRTEVGNSLSGNEQAQGGIFWLRPQEATPEQLDLGFQQVVGHNPGWAVRDIWGDNFVETDVGLRSGGVGAFVDTPYVTTKPVSILTESLGGVAPDLGWRTITTLKIEAMRDTIADVFLGWDGRMQAVEKLKASTEAVNALIDSLEKQMKEREAVGDSVGVKYLLRQERELLTPSGKDYLYGGIGFWRDIVMGRQNSVKVLDSIGSGTASIADLTAAVRLIGNVRSSIDQMPDTDVNRLFGYDKATVMTSLDTNTLDSGASTFSNDVADRLNLIRDVVDSGLIRNVAPYLDGSQVSAKYADVLQSAITSSVTSESVDLTKTSAGTEARTLAETPDTAIASSGMSLASSPEISPTLSPVTEESIAKSEGQSDVVSADRVGSSESQTLSRMPSESLPTTDETVRSAQESSRGTYPLGYEPTPGYEPVPAYEPTPSYKSIPPRELPPSYEQSPPYSQYPQPPYISSPRVPPPYSEYPQPPYSYPYSPPPPTPPPPPPPPPPPLHPHATIGGQRTAIPKSPGMFTWYQGERNVGGEQRDIWYIIKSPYKTAQDAFVSDYPPKGARVVKGAGAAHLTIKQLTGEAPSEVIMRMGVMDIEVTGKGDKINSIRYVPDPDHIYETQIDLKDATYLDSQPKRKYTVASKNGKASKKSKSRGKRISSDVGLGMIR